MMPEKDAFLLGIIAAILEPPVIGRPERVAGGSDWRDLAHRLSAMGDLLHAVRADTSSPRMQAISVR